MVRMAAVVVVVKVLGWMILNTAAVGLEVVVLFMLVGGGSTGIIRVGGVGIGGSGLGYGGGVGQDGGGEGGSGSKMR